MRPILLVLAATSTVSVALAAPPPAADTTKLTDHLHDEPGTVAGLPALTLTRTPDANHCTGFAVTVKRAGKLAPADAAIGTVYALVFPSGLNFDKAKDASTRRFNAWVDQLKQVTAAATEHYTAELATHDPQRALVASARMVQMYRYDATLLARAEIPADVRTGEFAADKIAAYCSQMAAVAQPVVDRATEAAQACHDHLGDVVPGWWYSVCGD